MPPKKIVFYGIAGRKYGMGHVARLLKLANALKAAWPQAAAHFFVSSDAHAQAAVHDRVGSYYPLTTVVDASEKIVPFAAVFKPDLIVVDHRNWSMTGLKPYVSTIVTLDNDESGADIYFNILKPPIELSSAVAYCGYPYWLHRMPEKKRQGIQKIDRILVACGYTDPMGISVNACRNVAAYYSSPHTGTPEITCVITSLYNNEVKQKIGEISSDIIIKQDLDGLEDALLKADLCINPGGNTLYEAIGCGIPSLVIACGADNFEMAKQLETDGFVAGVMTSETLDTMAAYLDFLEHGGIATVHRRCLEFPGDGLEKVVEIIKQHVHYQNLQA